MSSEWFAAPEALQALKVENIRRGDRIRRLENELEAAYHCIPNAASLDRAGYSVVSIEYRDGGTNWPAKWRGKMNKNGLGEHVYTYANTLPQLLVLMSEVVGGGKDD